jgi:hypothetical protein
MPEVIQVCLLNDSDIAALDSRTYAQYVATKRSQNNEEEREIASKEERMAGKSKQRELPDTSRGNSNSDHSHTSLGTLDRPAPAELTTGQEPVGAYSI